MKFNITLARNFSVSQILRNEVKRNKSPSVQYLFFDNNDIIDSFKGGFADIKNKLSSDVNTTYNAFSLTKTFTALSVLQLFERGKVDINNPVIEYLPSFPYGQEITINQLLNHTSGIPNPIPLSWIHLEAEHIAFNRNMFFDNVFNKYNQVNKKMVDKFSYSNLGYVILGQLIEKVSGMDYEEYVSENIFKKLLLEPKDLDFRIVDKEKHAKGYHKRISLSNFILGFFIDKNKFMEESESGWKPFKNFYVNGASYGGLIGRPEAFMRYIQELLKDDSSLISFNCKKRLFQENGNTGMCLSWFKGELNGVRYFCHSGGGGGYYSEMRIYPSIKKGSVIFFNRSGMSDERYLDKVDKFNI